MEYLPSDITVILTKSKKIYKLHKPILCLFSTYFKNLFSNSYIDSKSNIIEFDFDEKVFDRFVKDLYSNNFDLYIDFNEDYINLIKFFDIPGVVDKLHSKLDNILSSRSNSIISELTLDQINYMYKYSKNRPRLAYMLIHFDGIDKYPILVFDILARLNVQNHSDFGNDPGFYIETEEDIKNNKFYDEFYKTHINIVDKVKIDYFNDEYNRIINDINTEDWYLFSFYDGEVNENIAKICNGNIFPKKLKLQEELFNKFPQYYELKKLFVRCETYNVDIENAISKRLKLYPNDFDCLNDYYYKKYKEHFNKIGYYIIDIPQKGYTYMFRLINYKYHMRDNILYETIDNSL